MKILAIANQKGGTGKTTTALTLGALLSERVYRVLLVDMDPQASLTAWLGIDGAGRSMAEVIGGAQPGRVPLAAIIQEATPTLHLAPGDIALSSCELAIVQRLGRENVLKKALANVTGYDLVIIDCPPSLSLLTIAALVAADGVIAPVLPAPADLRGLSMFIDTLETIKSELNPALLFVGAIIVQFDGRTNSHNQALEALQGAGVHLLPPPVPRSVRVQESAASGQPLTEYDKAGKPAAAYELITNEVEKWLKAN